MPLASGEQFAGYKILKRLGAGGMGEVYLAQHPRLPRKKHAIKVLPPDLSAIAEYRARFYRTADLASDLYHEHIVSVHDRGEEDGLLWISMDYVDGLDVARLLKQQFPNGMPPDEVAKIVTAVASALDYAHNRRVLHRDVKPDNIMRSGDEQRILLADFGIARSLKESDSLTAKSFIVATVAYAAPEQLKGQKLDGRADQYALAKTAYHLLTGSQLFPESLAERPVGNAPLDSVLATALATNPDDRFPNCMDFAHALALALAEAGKPQRSLNTITTQTKRATTALPQPPDATRLATPHDFAGWAAPAKAQRAIDEGPPHKPRNRTAKERSGGFSHLLETFSDLLDTFSHLLVTVLLTAAIVCGIWLLVASGAGARLWDGIRSAIDTNSRSVTSTPASIAPSITFEGMQNFVTEYYGHLPANPAAAWAMVAPNNQKQTGHQDFLDFWATLQSVTVVSISPRDATSVIARLRYVRRDGSTDTEDRWFKMVLMNGTMLLDETQRIGKVNEATTTSTPTTTIAPPGQPLAERDLDGLLLVPDQINTAIGATGMWVSTTYTTMKDLNGQLSDTTCLPLADPADATVYAGSGPYAMRGQGLDEPSNSWTHLVYQNVVLFSSAEQAGDFFSASAQSWPACANRQYTYTQAGKPDQLWNVGPAFNTNGTLSATKTQVLGDGWTCQRALTVAKNVAIDVEACTKNASEFQSDPAVNIVHQIAAVVDKK